MADRIHPSAAKPNPIPRQSAPNGLPSSSQPSFPPAKSQHYNRPIYRPQPPVKRQQSRRRCCCSCFCWLVMIFISIIFLIALAGGVFYLLYRPQHPNFSVSSLQLTVLNVSASNHVTFKLNVAVTARNPNKKVVFIYDPISISVTSDGADVADGSFPGFVHGKKNTTVMRSTVMSSGQGVNPSVAADLRKSSIDLEIALETKAGVKLGGFKTKKMGIRVHCDGIRINVPKGKKTSPPLTPDARCRAKLRIKIWKWAL